MSRFYFGDSDSGSDDEAALPYPKPLARSAFLTPDFSPTEFLSTLRNRHQTLEDLRQDLRTRSQDLNKELLDLVNNNYRDFLGLGDSLKGGEERVEEVRLGLLGFRREIAASQQAVSTRSDEVKALIEERRAIVKSIRLGRHLLDVDAKLSELEQDLQLTNGHQNGDTDVSLDLLDDQSDSDEDSTIQLRRLVYRTQQFLLARRVIAKIGQSHPFLLKQEVRVLKIRQTLVVDLNNALKMLKSAPSTSSHQILKLLALYRDLGEDAEALKIIKTNR